MTDRALVDILERLVGTLREAGEEAAAAEAAAFSLKLRDEQLQVVVMGEFKRGKSSLINALLGKALLPVASIPLTAVVTVVKAGERETAFVEFLDGRRHEIPVAEVEDYVSEERNHKNHKQVDRVVVETPCPFLERGTLLVDTPGAGSVYRHNTEVTRKYIPNCDAVILVLSTDPPVSQSEVEFLHSIRRWAKKLFVVQNKIDYLSAADLERSVAFTEKVLRDALGDAHAAVFPLSAKLGLESKQSGDAEKLEKTGFPAFARSLQTLLDHEKRAVIGESVRSKARAMVDRVLIDVELRLGALRSGTADWERKSKSLEQALADARRKQYEVSKLFKAELEDHVKAMEEGLYARVRVETERISKDLERLYAAVKTEPGAQARAKLNRAFLDAVEDSFTRFLADEEPRWTKEFQAMTDRYLSGTLELVNAVLGRAAAALDVEHRPLSRPSITVAAPSVWFVLEEVSVWSGGIQSTPTLRVFKSFFWRALQRKIAEAMDVNAGRLRYDYARRLERAGDESLAAIQGFFESSIGVLERAVARASERGVAAREGSGGEASRLESYKTRLAGLSKELRS